MTLKGEYNAAILSELLVDKLKEGSIPTLEAVTDELDELKAAQPELGEKPMFSLEDNSVEYYENASAAKTNDTFDRYSKDVRTMWDTITSLKRTIVKNSRRWATAYETTKRYLDKLEDRVDNLLLLNSDTLGYFQYVSDNFSTTDYTDLEQTTALVDTGTGTVTIAQEATSNDNASRVSVDDIGVSNLSFTVVEATGYLSTTLAVDSSLLNALTDKYTTWLSYVKTSEQAAVTGALKLDLAESRLVNKIVFKVNGSTATSAFVLTAMYSMDGVDYLAVPTDGYTQSTLDTVTWIFPEIEARYFKFLMTKNGADDKTSDSYVYEFGAKNISFYAAGYDTSSSGFDFVSTVRSVLDEEGNPIEFQKAILSTCQQLPDGTDIHYSIGIDSGSVFVPIDPVELEDPSRPQILDFSDIVAVNNLGSTNVFDTDLDPDVLHLDDLSSYTLTGEADQVLNWYIPADDISSLDQTSVVVYRNVGDNTATDETVRGAARGWVYDADAGTYTTMVRIDDSSGLDIDFGTASVIIDGTSYTGTQNISQGSHTIVVSSDNWLEVDTEFDTLDELKAADTLYPYNHKLLVEGYQYGSNYTEERLYAGANTYVEQICSYVTTHEFNTQTDVGDMSVYTRDVDDDGKLVFVFKVDRSYADHGNERFLVEYKLANKTFTNVVLKAILTTTDESLTPLLSSYVIKLG